MSLTDAAPRSVSDRTDAPIGGAPATGWPRCHALLIGAASCWTRRSPAGTLRRMADESLVSRRPATEADREWARELHHRVVRDVVERQFGSWDEEQQDRFFANDWDSGGFEVIQYDGSPCGYVCIEDRETDVHLREIDIDTGYQRRGIGTVIIRNAITCAKARGVPVVLETLHENEAAGLYRRLGFAETGRTDTHTQFRLDT